jgi:hypothetical protein
MSYYKLIKCATKELVLDHTRLEISDNKLINCATKELVLDHTRLEMYLISLLYDISNLVRSKTSSLVVHLISL